MTLASACGTAEAEPVPHVKLGMAPRDVRDRFQPGVPGAWHTAVGIGEDTALEWKANAPPPSGFVDARFEFHLGMLVAIRAHAAGPSREGVSSTAKTVTARAADGSVTVLSRDCPTHKEEAERLASRAPR